MKPITLLRLLASWLALAGVTFTIPSLSAQTTIAYAKPAVLTNSAVTSTAGSPNVVVPTGTWAVGEVIRFTGTTVTTNPFNTAATNYYVTSVVGTTLQVSTTPGGAAVNAVNTTTVSTITQPQSWFRTANWTGGVVPNGNSTIAAFNGVASGVSAVVLNGDATLYELSNTGATADLTLISGANGTNLGTLTFATNDGTTPKLTLGASAAFVYFLGNGTTTAGRLKIAGNQGLVFNSMQGPAIVGSGLNATSANPAKNSRVVNVDWSAFTGGLQIERGAVQPTTDNAFPSQTLTVGNAQTVTNNLLAGFTVANNTSIGALNGNSLGRIWFARTLTVGADGGSGDFGGVIGKDFPGAVSNTAIIKSGAGRQNLSGIMVGGGTVTVNGGALAFIGAVANTYTGATTVNNGSTLLVNAPIASTVTVNAGTLGGTGSSSASVTIGNGTGTADSFLAPGDGGIGVFTTTGALTLRADSTYAVELNSNTSAVDKIVASAVTLDNNPILNVTDLGSTDLSTGTGLTIVDNTGGGTVSGTFSGLPEGGTFAVGPNVFRITYVGGTGNDIVLVVPPAAPLITSPATTTGTADTMFSFQIVGNHSPTGYDATNLPAGLTVNTATGVISGTVTMPGIYHVVQSASNALGTGFSTLDITINPHADAPVITNGSTVSATVGSPLSYQIVATNGATSYTVVGLPPGLTLNAVTGLISGTPTSSSTQPITVIAGNGHNGVSTILLTIGSAPFIHPGVYASLADLNRMRAKVAANAQPWLDGFNKLAADPRSSATYAKRGPFASVGRNTVSGVPDNRVAFEEDGAAVLQNAVMWFITGNQAHANKAIEIMDAWSDPTGANHLENFIGADRRLLAGIEGQKWVGGAEIIRHTGAGWSAAGIANFSAMLRNIIYPVTRQYGGGNWGTAGMAANMGMAVFLEDHEMFDEAVSALKQGGRTQCDNSMSTYVEANGQNSESDRDQGHSQLGVAHLTVGAEVAWQQGVDLYGYLDNRLLAGMEYLASYNSGNEVPFTPSYQCDGLFNPSISSIDRGALRPIYEMAWNHYQNRMGLPAPFMTQVVALKFPEGYDLDHLGFGSILFRREALTVGLPMTPQGLLSIADNAKVDLQWSASLGATGYNVKRATSRGGPFTTVASGVTATDYSDNTVSNDTLYFYAVTAVNATGETINSGLTLAYPSNAAPAAPLGVAAAAANKVRVDLSWNESLGATSYAIKRATSSGGPYTTVASVSSTTYRSYADTGLSPSTPYYYVISALNTMGEGVASAEVSATTLAGLPAPWVGGDAGYLTTPGQATESGGTFTMKAAGLDIGGTDDSFYFVYQPVSGDATITLRVASRSIYSQIHKSFLMMRESLDNGARHQSVGVNGLDQVQSFHRESTNGSTAATTLSGTTPLPRWLRIVRQGNTFITYISADGVGWSNVDTRTVAMNNTLFVGMAVASRNNAVLDTVVFDNASVVNTALPTPLINSALGVSSLANDPFSYQITATNLPTGYNASGLPAGLSIDPATGLISGVPTTPGTYTVVLSATNASGQTGIANLTLIISPFFLSGAATSSSQAALSWPASANAVGGYNVKRAMASGGPYSVIAVGVADSSYSDTGLTSGTNYYYQVAVVGAGSAEINLSNEARALTLASTHVTLVSDSFTTASAAVTGRTPQETTIEGRVYQSVPATNTMANSVASGVARMTTNMGEAISLASGGAYTKPTEFWIQATFNTGTLTNNTPARPARGIYVGFWSAIPASGESVANARGVFINAEDGELHLWNGGSAPDGIPLQTLPYNGIWVGGAAQLHTVSYTVNTATGMISNFVLDGTAYYWSTTAIFNNANTAFAGFGISAGASGQVGNIDSFELSGSTTPPALPAAPTNLIVAVNGQQIDLSWTAATGATSYAVKRGTSASGPFTTLASGLTATTYTDLTAINGTPYYYVVTAANSTGESPASAVSNAATTVAPVPVALSFDLRTANGKKMTATDLAGAGNARFANWNGFVGPTGGSQTVTLTSVVDSNAAAVTGLTATLVSGTTGSTHDRDSALAVPNDPQMFNTVLDQQNGTASTLTVTGIPYATYDVCFYVWWDENSANANDRGGRFTVGGTTYYLRTGTATKLTASDGTGYLQSTDTNAAVGPATQLGNYVRFTGLTGNLSASFVALNMGASTQRLKIAGFQIVSPTTPAVTTAPAAPTGVLALPAPGQVSVQWSAANTATSYTVKRATSAGGPFTAVGTTSAAANTFIDTTVTNGTTYFYVVAATNAIGSSADSVSANATPIDPKTIAAFSVKLRAYNTYGLPVTDSAGVVRLGYWNNLVGPAIAGQTVELGSPTNHLGLALPGVTVAWTAGTTGGSYTNSGTLKFGTDAVTVGPASNDLNLYSSAFDQYDGTASTLTITGMPFASYDAYFYIYDGGAAQGGTITANGTTLAVRGGAGSPSAVGSGYVRSTDEVNTSGTGVQQGNYVRFSGLTGDLTASFLATNVGSATQRLKIAGFQIVSNATVAAPTAVPAAPVSLVADGGNTAVSLNWTATATATSYKVYKNGSLLATVAAPLTSYADTAVTNGTAYVYTLTALNAVGESAPSANAVATPAAPAFTLPPRTVYQYSLPMTPIFSNRLADPQRRAYLWVPPGSTKLQGVIVGLHNMLEKPLFDDPAIRQACADANLGIVFISAGDSKTWTPNGVGNYTPGPVSMCLDLDPNSYVSPDINPATSTNYTTDINPATGTRFTNQSEQAGAELAALLTKFATESGYAELQYAPVMLAGHSAASPFVWTRSVYASAALSGRVFALLPYKGSFPGAIPAGIPIFHTASEWQEISNWGNTWELGDAPALRGLRAGGTDRLLSSFVQPGTGHYDYSETQSGPLATFIRKSAQYRIPANWPATGYPTLSTIDPATGYVVDVTQVGSGNCQPVSYAAWVAAGKDPLRAYWYFDAATAQAVCDAQNAGFARRPQMINGFQNATTLAPLATQSNGTGYVNLSATLLADGVSFKVRAAPVNQSPVSRLFYGAPLGLASGPVRFKANGSGALKQTGADTFRVWMDRGTVIKEGQPWEPFIIAQQPGDANFREADRPIWLTTSVPVNNITGAAQTITFPTVPDQVANSLQPLTLNATASSGLPVQYWVVSGPYRNDESNSAEIIPDQLPAKPSYPLRVVIGAWQWGQPGTTAAATAVFKEFFIQPPPPVVTSALTADGVFGTAFSYAITATNTPTSFSATPLPAGLVLDAATGIISGQPVAAGQFTLTLSATNAGGTGTAPLTLTVAPAPATVALAALTVTYDGVGKSPAVTTAPAGLAVLLTYNGSPVAPVNAGSYAVVATIADANYVGSTTDTFVIAPAPVTITLGSLVRIYDGTPQVVIATPTPASVAVNVTYAGSADAPSPAGSYAVVATSADANYTGSVTGTLVIAKAAASIALSNLTPTYDGTPKSALATTTPENLSVALTYDGSSTAPTQAGSYAVAAVITDPNHSGFASGTLVIGQATATVTLGSLRQPYDGTAKSATATTAPEGLTVKFTYNGAVAAPVYPGTYAVIATIDDENYTGSVSGSLIITVTALVRHAPLIQGTIEGSLQVLLGESMVFSGNSMVSGDLLVPGTPPVYVIGNALYAGFLDGPGSAVPSNYSVWLTGNALLRYLVRHVDPLAFPTVTAPPAPAGTHSVLLTNAGQNAGDFTTLRNLTLSGNAGLVTVPPGTYGNFVASGNSGFVLGVAGATEPAIYNLQNLSINPLLGAAQLKVVGPIILTVANNVTLFGATGSAAHPEWLTLRVSSGGLIVTGKIVFHGTVLAPNGSVTLNTNSTVNGSVTADRLIINGNALLTDPAL